MAGIVNRLKNSTFSRGKNSPTGWLWRAGSRQIQWRRQPPDGSQPGGIVISSSGRMATANWSQEVHCRPREFYRIEARVTCNLSPFDDEGGLVLRVDCLKANGTQDSRSTPPHTFSAKSTLIRACFQAPSDVGHLRISVGIERAKGEAFIQQVGFIHISEPQDASHPLAIPAPGFLQAAPKTVRSVGVCSRTIEERRIARLIGDWFGKENVLASPSLREGLGQADAVILPHDGPHPGIRSLRGLLDFASERIVVISLPAFARLAGESVVLRCIRQIADSMYAKVTFSCYATKGFALNDVFPFSWTEGSQGAFMQRQFRKTGRLDSFCKRHGFRILMESVTDLDGTSGQPIAFYRPMDRGDLFVLDVEPAEDERAALGDSSQACHLFFSILGKTQTGLGQYVVPQRSPAEFRDLVREMANRFDGVAVQDDDVPAAEVRQQRVTIGREDQSFGLPLKEKPLILIRSGLVSGDVESVYSALFWLKQLLRRGQWGCAYADRLAWRFRFSWVPCEATWEPPEGWSRRAQPAFEPTRLDDVEGPIAALIDVASMMNRSRPRVVIPARSDAYQRYFAWIPVLNQAFYAGQYVQPEVHLSEVSDTMVRRPAEPGVQVVVDTGRFTDRIHQEVVAGGGEVIRIEIPTYGADFAAHSIEHTDIGATLLEHVVGLQFGLIAVNRTAEPISFHDFGSVARGEALLLDHHELKSAIRRVPARA